jgi:hypothetical protein
MTTRQRPLHDSCTLLTIVEVVRAGLPTWEVSGSGLAKTLGPGDHRRRIIGLETPVFVPISARMVRCEGVLGVGTLLIGAPFPDRIWVDEIRVPIARDGSHWCFRCQGCGQQCRRLLWPPAGKAWRCRRCVRPRYRDTRRMNTLPLTPDVDPLDALLRDVLRLREIRNRNRLHSPRREPT